MTKRPAKKASSVKRKAGTSGTNAVAPDDDTRFADVVELIEAARNRAYQAVNVELVSLYWQLGQHISQKIARAEWGDAVVDELAAALARRYAGLRGFYAAEPLPDAAALRRKLHELYAQLASGTDADGHEDTAAAPDTSAQPAARRSR